MNKTANLRRIQNEVKQLKEQDNQTSNIFKINMVDDNMYHWRAIIYGPDDSLYEGYEFELDIQLPDDYPFSPITVKFKTQILHVNVNTKGDMCLDILKNKGSSSQNNWVPSQNIRSVLLSICSLLHEPNVDDSLNSDLAELYRTDKNKYITTIRDACAKFATPMAKKLRS